MQASQKRASRSSTASSDSNSKVSVKSDTVTSAVASSTEFFLNIPVNDASQTNLLGNSTEPSPEENSLVTLEANMADSPFNVAANSESEVLTTPYSTANVTELEDTDKQVSVVQVLVAYIKC